MTAQDWNDGYTKDVNYTYGYYQELNPNASTLALLNQGYVAPEINTACELGFGQGLSINIHTAASTRAWSGNDFNPSQVEFAQALASASDLNARLVDDSFAEFLTRDLPQFDYIGLHGVWSWISEENRSLIVQFVRKYLRVGGVLYISYNTLPGWGTFAPIRHLMARHADIMGSQGDGVKTRVDQALDFTERLLQTKPKFATAVPLTEERLAQAKSQDSAYLAHEYFNRDWRPMYFDEVATLLGSAKLTYACSGTYTEHVNALNLTDEQVALLDGIPDLVMRETARDFMTNQQFRRDYWIKGARKLTPQERAERLRQQRVILCKPPKDVTLDATGARGKAILAEKIYTPILNLMGDHKIRTIGEITDSLASEGINLSQCVEAAVILCSKNALCAAQDEDTIERSIPSALRLNSQILKLTLAGEPINFLASPVTGGGVYIDRVQQLFLNGKQRNCQDTEALAEFASSVLASNGQYVVKEGKTLGVAEGRDELTTQAKAFEMKTLPILRELKVI